MGFKIYKKYRENKIIGFIIVMLLLVAFFAVVGTDRPANVQPQSNPSGKVVKPFIPVKDQLVQTGYKADFTSLQTNGQGVILLDNTQNGFHVKVAVYYLDGDAESLVRVCSIRSGEQFAISNLSPGKYDIRFRDLITGKCFRVEESILFAERSGQAVEEQGAISVKLFSSESGNKAIVPILLSEFEPSDREL